MGDLAPRNLSQTGRREILHLLRSHDLSVSAISCPLRRGLDTAENLEPRLELIREAMELAYELGPRLVILPIGKIPAPPPPAPEGSASSPGSILLAPMTGLLTSPERAADLLKESLEALGRHGDRIGVTVALETGPDDPEFLTAYLDRFDVGSLAVNYNPANLVLGGFNPYQAIRTFGRRLAHAHAQDARRVSPSKLATVPVGHGDLDWMQLLAHFEEIEYRRHLTVLGNDRAETAAGLALLRRLIP